MLRTRLWMGAILIALATGVLFVDSSFYPTCPFLFALVLLASQLACFELLRLLPLDRRPSAALVHIAVILLLGSNWLPHLGVAVGEATLGVLLAGVVLAGFLLEMRTFAEPGASIVRMAAAIWVISYLGLLPCYLVKLRWLAPSGSVSPARMGAVALALGIFVPKSCDIGAYFTGRLFGRHKMSPVLSPKKTWEGAIGGLFAASLAAVAINRAGPFIPSDATAAAFGLVFGLAGMLGDLAESLIKRDCRQKDASQVVPGFGGILDVIDAVIFAAPVVYVLLLTQVI